MQFSVMHRCPTHQNLIERAIATFAGRVHTNTTRTMLYVFSQCTQQDWKQLLPEFVAYVFSKKTKKNKQKLGWLPVPKPLTA